MAALEAVTDRSGRDLVRFPVRCTSPGSRMTGERSARFALLADYDVWAPRWTGRVAWAERATQPDWFEIVERATPRERSVFGWPVPGDPYWDEQTLADTQTRYPRADLTPYR